MNCDDVRRALIERPSGVHADLNEHLATCAACRVLAEEIRRGEAAVEGWVDEFERAGSFDAAWKRAVADPAPAWNPRTWALAAATLLVVGALAAWQSGRPTVDTSEGVVAPSQEHALALQPPDRMSSKALVEVAPAPVRSASMVPAPRDVDCDDLVRLEPSAMMGKLSADEVDCLEARFAEETPRERDRISRVLMANAYSMGAMQEWASLVERHMTEVAQSDPDLAYKYALYLSKKTAGRSEDVIRWADVALRHAGVWNGDTYKSRIYSLHKLRTAAALQQWEGAEARRDGTAQAEALSIAARDRTRAFAEEWHAVAVRTSKDTAPAAALCEMAGDPCD